jgi:hypothetical protein
VSGPPALGERVPYRLACAATRQAHQRARDAGLSFGEWRVLAAVLDKTTSYSKLADEVARGELARWADLSADRTAKALAKLSSLGIVFYRAGLGAGNLSVVAVPPPGAKGDVYASAFGAGQTSPFEEPERRRRGRGKGDVQRAREKTEEREEEPERLSEEGTVGATGSSPRPKLATEVGEGTERSTIEKIDAAAVEQPRLFGADPAGESPPWA